MEPTIVGGSNSYKKPKKLNLFQTNEGQKMSFADSWSEKLNKNSPYK